MDVPLEKLRTLIGEEEIRGKALGVNSSWASAGLKGQVERAIIPTQEGGVSQLKEPAAKGWNKGEPPTQQGEYRKLSILTSLSDLIPIGQTQW